MRLNTTEEKINTLIYINTCDDGNFLHKANVMNAETSSVYLSVLCEMMVQQLGVGLLMWRQDVQEGSRGITRSAPRVQRPCST